MVFCKGTMPLVFCTNLSVGMQDGPLSQNQIKQTTNGQSAFLCKQKNQLSSLLSESIMCIIENYWNFLFVQWPLYWLYIIWLSMYGPRLECQSHCFYTKHLVLHNVVSTCVIFSVDRCKRGICAIRIIRMLSNMIFSRDQNALKSENRYHISINGRYQFKNNLLFKRSQYISTENFLHKLSINAYVCKQD